jgi:hypothetical protein
MSIHLTLLPAQVAEVDAWAEKWEAPSRPEAIRRLLLFALSKFKGA